MSENYGVFATSQWKPHDPVFIRLDRVPACDGQTDGRKELPCLLQRSALQAMRPCCKNKCHVVFHCSIYFILFSTFGYLVVSVQSSVLATRASYVWIKWWNASTSTSLVRWRFVWGRQRAVTNDLFTLTTWLEYIILSTGLYANNHEDLDRIIYCLNLTSHFSLSNGIHTQRPLVGGGACTYLILLWVDRPHSLYRSSAPTIPRFTGRSVLLT